MTETSLAIPRNAVVVASPGCGTPTTLLRRLATRAITTPGIVLRSGLLLDYSFLDAVQAGHLGYESWHLSGRARTLAAEGKVGYIPARASSVPHLIRKWTPDVALIRVSPPDRTGLCSLGPTVSYVPALVRSAKLVIGEVDRNLPRTCGESDVPASLFHQLVESEHPTPSYVAASPTAEARSIGDYILPLIPPDPTIQIGIGAIAETFVAMLAETGANGLRFVGLATDAMAESVGSRLLAQSNVPDPAIFAPEILGTRVLMDYVRENPQVGLYPSERAHDPWALGTIPRLVSVQGALEVDLMGQVASEWAGGRWIAGVGGSVDYAEAARRSPGGVRIIALRASSEGGDESRIVPHLGTSPATLPSHLVDFIVTEHGVARLEGLSARDRGEAMIELAAPAHRSSLRDAWSSLPATVSKLV